MTDSGSLLDDTRAILAELIGFATISADSNLALIDWCAGRLEALGAKIEISRDATGQGRIITHVMTGRGEL